MAARRGFHTATIALGSFLLFLVQPMIARMALPRLGGSPAVWNSAMFVYQSLLLAGYGYAHLLSRRSARTQSTIHIALMLVATAWLPIGLNATMMRNGADPVLWTPALIAMSIGPLFLIIAAQAPLVQRWYAANPGADPYPLYAASNIGSIVGLLCYPFLLEPLTSIREQSILWTIGYLVLIAASTGCALMLRTAPQQAGPERIRMRPASAAKWIALAAIPSGLMLSTTTTLTTDVVATPMLWVLPLGIYLLSFVAAFSGKEALIVAATRVAPILILVEAGASLTTTGQAPEIMVPLGLATLYAVGVALHGTLWRTRPAPDQLTGFYLMMAVGGAVGGLFCAILAPALFNWTWEHPILLTAAALAIRHVPLVRTTRVTSKLAWSIAFICIAATVTSTTFPGTMSMLSRIVIAGCGLLAVNLVGRRPLFAVCLLCLVGVQVQADRQDSTDIRFRSYFGTYRIVDVKDARALMNGTTTHGIQRLRPKPSDAPLSYYSDTSGVGRAMKAVPYIFGASARIGVVGLGAGTLACYRTDGQRWQFNEIDPKVISVATDPSQFTYVHDCAPEAKMIAGDARLTLSRQDRASLNVIVLDAFSSDAIPMHLMTRQAFDLYDRVVGPHGLVIVHISNRVLDLEPVLAAMPEWQSILLRDEPDRRREKYNTTSVWIAMSRNRSVVDTVRSTDTRWRALKPRPGFRPWTDDKASILPLIKGF